MQCSSITQHNCGTTLYALTWHAPTWCHACNLLSLICFQLHLCGQCLQTCVVIPSRCFTYVRAQFWMCVCTQSDQVELTCCCCCWTGCPPRPQACSWAKLHCALYVTRGGSRGYQVAAQQHTHHFVGSSICQHDAVVMLQQARSHKAVENAEGASGGGLSQSCHKPVGISHCPPGRPGPHVVNGTSLQLCV